VVLSKIVWILNNFLEILAEELVIIRQRHVPIEVGGCPGTGSACQASEDLTDTAEVVLVVLKAERHVIAQLGQKAVQQPWRAIKGAWV
jgi:hypothetical protein